MHESTVSRVTTNKYVQTPRGVFELKYFFSPAWTPRTADEVSAKAPRQDPAHHRRREADATPLSDQKIVDLLKKDGLNIARRTVAKYREQLGILPGADAQAVLARALNARACRPARHWGYRFEVTECQMIHVATFPDRDDRTQGTRTSAICRLLPPQT